MDERPTVDVVLSTGAKVTLFSFLVNKDNKALQRLALSGQTIKFDDNGDQEEIKEIPAAVSIDMHALTVKLLVKEIVLSNGEKVTNIDEFLDYMSSDDAQVLSEKVNELTKKSKLDAESKKK